MTTTCAVCGEPRATRICRNCWRQASAADIERNAREMNLLGDIAFCPVCGEPRATRDRGDLYICRNCWRGGTIAGWTR